MRENVTLILLANHKPSEDAQKELLFWLKNNPYVVISTLTIEDSVELHRAKKEWRFQDLPCLVNKDGRQTFRYYGDGITAEVKRMYERWGNK